MKVIDFHCDTLTRIQDKEEFSSNTYHIDYQKLIKGDYLLQDFAIFTDLQQVSNPYQYVLDHIKLYEELIKTYSLLNPIYSYKDMKDNKINTLLSLEEGSMIPIHELKEFYKKGIRIITPSWNYPNGITHPNIVENKDSYHYYNTTEGLTDKGIEYIKECERLGIIIDVSHMSDQSFYDTYKYTNCPIIASHSNSRSICSHSRNLSDDMLKKIASRGGIVGINYYAPFIKKHASYTKLEDMITHIDYIKSLIGIDYIVLGSDFDGIDCNLDIVDASYIQLLKDELIKHHYTTEDIEKIYYKNALRFIKNNI